MSEQDPIKEDLKEQESVVEEVAEEKAATSEQQADTQEQESGEVEEQNVDSQISELQAQVDKYKEAFVRAKADEENVRRRSEKEVANSRKFAVEGFAKELLSVADSLKLATSSQIEDEAVKEAVKPIQEGVEITLKQLEAALDKFAVKKIEAKPGDKPDPNLHQAMSMVESDEVESGQIVNVIQDGYQLHDRLLRPALVVVAK
jgi:molecular chaperone GrpE